MRIATLVGNPDGPCAVEPGVTTTMRLTPVIGVQRSSGEPVPRLDLEPIFAELAGRCASASTWTVVVAGPAPASDTVFLYGVP
ncbi:hypothetical protein ACFWNE_23305 [Streptomyces goshikiensis]|uniref:hypothetical protein n=1 Tax=Streptomyces goshikiensis TaxID=1942 RepID=UPI0036501B9C